MTGLDYEGLALLNSLENVFYWFSPFLISMIKAVIFDLDGTLIDTNKIHLAEFKRVFKDSFSISLKDSEILPLFGESVGEIVSRLLSRHGKAFSKKQVGNLVRQKVSLYASEIRKKHLMHASTLKFLKKLRKKGLKLAIASGTERKMLNASLKPKELRLFDALVCANDVKRAKPFPDELSLAVKKLGLRKSECLFVGDGLLDAKAAENAGVRFAALLSGIVSRKEFQKLKPVAVLKEIKGLEKVLAKL